MITTLAAIEAAEDAVAVLERTCSRLGEHLRELHKFTMRTDVPSASASDIKHRTTAEHRAAQAVMEVDHAADELVFATKWLSDLIADRKLREAGAAARAEGPGANAAGAGGPAPQAGPAVNAADTGRRVAARRTA